MALESSKKWSSLLPLQKASKKFESIFFSAVELDFLDRLTGSFKFHKIKLSCLRSSTSDTYIIGMGKKVSVAGNTAFGNL